MDHSERPQAFRIVPKRAEIAAGQCPTRPWLPRCLRRPCPPAAGVAMCASTPSHPCCPNFLGAALPVRHGTAAKEAEAATLQARIVHEVASASEDTYAGWTSSNPLANLRLILDRPAAPAPGHVPAADVTRENGEAAPAPYGPHVLRPFTEG